MSCTTIACVEAKQAELAAEVDAAWALSMGILVFFMQCGFTMLEAGSVRTKNVTNIIFKNMADLILSSIGYWMFGWGVAFGGDHRGVRSTGFMGEGEVCLVSSGYPAGTLYPYYFFHFAFAATATTIVSGAVAERVTTIAYGSFAFTMASFIYPVVAHWVWSTSGWMSPFNPGSNRLGDNGALDFAGGGAVHLVGGTAALVGAIIIGPRRGRFGPPGEPLADAIARANNFKPHNRVIFSLGTLILWFGFYGFNCGSTLAVSNGKIYLAAKVALNTTLAGAGASIAAAVLSRLINKHIDIDSVMNGTIAGLASITSGASLMEPYLGLITGIVGGACYFGFAHLLIWLRVDDPIQATAVHFAGGAWALFATGLFASSRDIELNYGFRPTSYGLFVGGGWQQLGLQCLEIVCIVAWVSAWAVTIFGLFRLCRLLRVPREVENAGLDQSLHGGAVYDLHDLRELTGAKPEGDMAPSWTGADRPRAVGFADTTIMESSEYSDHPTESGGLIGSGTTAGTAAEVLPDPEPGPLGVAPQPSNTPDLSYADPPLPPPPLPERYSGGFYYQPDIVPGGPYR
eukprot:EG_transcript_3134